MVEENLEFDPQSFFDSGGTGGMFTSSAKTVAEPEKPKKKSQYASTFGGSWKKKKETQKINIALSTEAANKIEVSTNLKYQKLLIIFTYMKFSAVRFPQNI